MHYSELSSHSRRCGGVCKSGASNFPHFPMKTRDFHVFCAAIVRDAKKQESKEMNKKVVSEEGRLWSLKFFNLNFLVFRIVVLEAKAR